MADKYARVITRALSQPWALTPEYLAIVQDILLFRARGGRLTAAEIRARIGEDDAPPPTARTAGAVAVVPIHGVIAHRTFDASSGMTSTEAITKMLRRVVADEDVKSIVLDTSSPGGGVEGVPELAAEILAARKVKYIVGHVNDLMASAGYWLGSQASEIVSTPSGQAGSIGVFALHQDLSAMLEQEGIKITALVAGDRKLEGAPWAPLDDEARAHFQAGVDAVYRDFLAAVARGRGVDVKVVKETYGQGRVFDAKDAKKRGMIDRIETLDETIARLAGGGRRASTGRAAASPRAGVDELHERATADVVDALAAGVHVEDADACPSCKGSGLKPESFMGDPEGQKPCAACGGSGKAQKTDQAAADRDALAIAAAMAD